ncbi:hypothetical protein B0H19DRAFT_1143413 [Mycena capillaripes]|nr:hypothetical protein B0H19DRAFT_1143413 [Mycena capillaripes]
MEHARLGGRKVGDIHLLIVDLQALQDMRNSIVPETVRRRHCAAVDLNIADIR